MTTRNKFRNAVNNQRLTQALFFETTAPETRDYAIYSLSKVDKEWNGRKFKSLYKLYMAENDILEHDFATKYFESWDHWKQICETKFMRELIASWREELDVRIRSDALKIIQAEVYNNTKYSYPAAVYIAKQGWKDRIKTEDTKTTKKGAGRPTKASIAEEANRIAMEAHDVSADLQRLGIKVN